MACKRCSSACEPGTTARTCTSSGQSARSCAVLVSGSGVHVILTAPAPACAKITKPRCISCCSSPPSVTHLHPSRPRPLTGGRQPTSPACTSCRQAVRNPSRPIHPGNLFETTSRHSAVGLSGHDQSHQRPLSRSKIPATMAGHLPSASARASHCVGTGCHRTPFPSRSATGRPAVSHLPSSEMSGRIGAGSAIGLGLAGVTDPPGLPSGARGSVAPRGDPSGRSFLDLPRYGRAATEHKILCVPVDGSRLTGCQQVWATGVSPRTDPLRPDYGLWRCRRC